MPRILIYLTLLVSFIPPASNAELTEDFSEMAKVYAPRIWWHSQDPFTPLDPLKFIENSSLWVHESWGGRKQVAGKGELNPAELGNHNSGIYAAKAEEGTSPARLPSTFSVAPVPVAQAEPALPPEALGKKFFMVYEDPTLATGEDRDWARTSLEGRSYTQPIRDGAAPILWRLRKLKGDSKSGLAILEYWYHVSYSYANSMDIGNHQGDWEGFAVLLELKTGDHGRVQHRPLAYYLAQHESGHWRCPSEIQWVSEKESADRHPELFTALGTHATYHEAGQFKTPYITDKTARGRAWDSWKLLRRLEDEPYYGYSGAWGNARFFSFMSGPLGPNPNGKFLPGPGALRKAESILKSCSKAE